MTESLNHSALQMAMDAYEVEFPDAQGIDYNGLKAGISAYLAAMEDASTRKDEVGAGTIGAESVSPSSANFNSTLNHCPYPGCSGEGRPVHVPYQGWQVSCRKCEWGTGIYEEEENAKNAWNKRACSEIPVHAHAQNLYEDWMRQKPQDQESVCVLAHRCFEAGKNASTAREIVSHEDVYKIGFKNGVSWAHDPEEPQYSDLDNIAEYWWNNTKEAKSLKTKIEDESRK